jgi:Cof subfamily protein (haloacid dehalogenase superfamily)
METPPATNIRALFFDLDGTLLTSRRDISPKTLSALRDCAGKGIRIFAATARPPNIGEQFSLSREDSALIRDGAFLNGAWVRLDGREEIRCIGEGAARDIVDAAWTDPEVNIALQLSDGRHAFRRPIAETEWGHWGLRGDGDVLAFSGKDEIPAGILKILLFERSDGQLSGKRLDDLHDRLSRSQSAGCRLYLSDGGSVIQAMDGSASKKNGIDIIRKLLGYRADQIAVFGDDANDREMLASFPYSIAMGNAPLEIAALARYRTKGNDEDGIAFALADILRLV